MAGKPTSPQYALLSFPLLISLLTSGALVLAISRRKKIQPASSQTPTIDATMEHIESASLDDQRILRNAVSIVPLPPLFRLLNSF